MHESYQAALHHFDENKELIEMSNSMYEQAVNAMAAIEHSRMDETEQARAWKTQADAIHEWWSEECKRYQSEAHQEISALEDAARESAEMLTANARGSIHL